jgi:FlaA1/EpsC-like NDP-sugar epimerase
MQGSLQRAQAPIKRLIHRLRTPSAALVHDLSMVPVAWLAAYWLRFNLDAIPPGFLEQGLWLLPLVLILQGAVFWYFGLYRGVWRFASMPDLLRIAKAVAAGTLLAAMAVFALTQMVQVPRSVFPLYALVLLVLLGGPRFVYRWLKDHSHYGLGEQRVLIVGAGTAGERLARELLRDPERLYDPVAFVDDDRGKQGREIHGLPVVGTTRNLARAVRRLSIEVILIALPRAPASCLRRVVEQCEGSGVPFRIVPRMEDLVSGRASFKELREVSIEDLLGREPVSLDWQAIAAGLSGRTVLVSGGGGSIGSELCRQIAALQPAALIVLEKSEFNLYQVELELRARFPEVILHLHLGDVCDGVAVDHVLARHRPSVVFHAAAYKHVPLLEDQVREAAQNNVLGTRNLALAADRHGAAVFVLISTDKAVNPTNVMGTTKRVGEILCQNLNRHSRTRFITVRFGNVLDSAGSVVPLFRRQIERGGPVTVTHPAITRYFMTIPEASQLIMQAAVMGEGGEIFVLDMGEPVKIAYLAEQMIRLTGKVPGEDVEIVYTGLRPGEKLYEELFHEQEYLADTEHSKILLARHREVDWTLLSRALDQIAEACQSYDEGRLRELLTQLVPERHPSPAAEGPADRIPLARARA